MILFNKPPVCALNVTIDVTQDHYLQQSKKILESLYDTSVFLVHTCTAALEISALALDIQPGDEVIMPSFTFVATANAFVRCGATIVFVDVDETMNINLDSVEKAITERTKVVVPVHYGGLCCDMDRLMMLSNQFDFYVVEDAAQSIGAYYKQQALGTIGHLGCLSFHQTKNIHCGEGGALIVNDMMLERKIDHIINHGTNRRDFLSGTVSAYTWQSIGGAYGLDEFRAYVLFHQLESLVKISERRRTLFMKYLDCFNTFRLPEFCTINGHIFFVKTKSEDERKKMKIWLADGGIQAVSHYEPLHQSAMGKHHKKVLDLKQTEQSNCLLRLPLYYDLTDTEQEIIIERVKEFYE